MTAKTEMKPSTSADVDQMELEMNSPSAVSLASAVERDGVVAVGDGFLVKREFDDDDDESMVATSSPSKVERPKLCVFANAAS